MLHHLSCLHVQSSFYELNACSRRYLIESCHCLINPYHHFVNLYLALHTNLLVVVDVHPLKIDRQGPSSFPFSNDNSCLWERITDLVTVHIGRTDNR